MRLEGVPAYVLKKCKEVNSIFSQKWHSQEMLHQYIATFSHNSSKKLPASQKLQHSLTECNSCPSFFPALTHAFPGRKRALSERNAVEITITASPHLQMPPAKLAKKFLRFFIRHHLSCVYSTCIVVSHHHAHDISLTSPLSCM